MKQLVGDLRATRKALKALKDKPVEIKAAPEPVEIAKLPEPEAEEPEPEVSESDLERRNRGLEAALKMNKEINKELLDKALADNATLITKHEQDLQKLQSQIDELVATNL